MMIPTRIRYVVGDATKPEGEGLKAVVHCCNDLGAWGAGFTKALSDRWKAPEERFRSWWRSLMEDGFHDVLPLGAIQFIPVEDDIIVCNLVGQRGYGPARPGRPYVRYHAIHTGLAMVCMWAKANDATVHMPRMGAGLAGGSWDRIAQVIDEELCRYGVKVTVYDLPGAA